MLNKIPTILLILDGWGISKQKQFNAIECAKTPNWDYFLGKYPHTQLKCDSKWVGLPDNQMGNSEVGHLHIGSGRVIPQSLLRINQLLDNPKNLDNTILNKLILNKTRIQILGLLSPGGVHSHENHFMTVLKYLKESGLDTVFFHLFLDGRDTPPQSAAPSINKLETLCNKLNVGKIASITGRYYAMDRDNRWDRTQACYNVLFNQQEATGSNSIQALHNAYNRDETDEFVQPTLLEPKSSILPNDLVILLNFRADRMRQLTNSIINPMFNKFKTCHDPDSFQVVAMTNYDSSFNIPTISPSLPVKNSLGEILAKNNIQQIRIAETEKYAHVTYFLNGGVEQTFENEQRLLIPSPKVKTYDLQPQMSVHQVTDAIIHNMNSFDVLICNFANADMVGHTGNFEATIKAIEAIDECLGKIYAQLMQSQGSWFITADHGNAEQMLDSNFEQPHTAHTNNSVPLLWITKDNKHQLKPGTLIDVAPTLLHSLSLNVPACIQGKSLIK